MNIGASIYPSGHSIKKMKKYIDRLHHHGISRIFLSILHLKKDDQEQLQLYHQLIRYIKSKNMIIIADINPQFIQEFDWTENLSKKIIEFGIDIVRFDEALDIEDLVKLSQNENGLKLEVNMSTGTQIISDLFEKGADLSNITASHNFYPRKYTGLSIEHFMKMTNIFKSFDVETACFINSPTAQEGPWNVSEGLCTLEKHRYQSLETQIMFYKLIGNIDNVIIANQFIPDDELDLIVDVINKPMTLRISTINDLTDIEKAIIGYKHVYRGDVSDYLIRSSQTRIAFKNEQIDRRYQAKNCKRGDILIDNDMYTRYKGELYIALKPHNIGEKTNIVGNVIEEQQYLLDYLKPWQSFELKVEE